MNQPRNRTPLIGNHRLPAPPPPPPPPPPRIAPPTVVPATGDARLDSVLYKLRRIEGDLEILEARIEYQGSAVVDRIIQAMTETA